MRLKSNITEEKRMREKDEPLGEKGRALTTEKGEPSHRENRDSSSREGLGPSDFSSRETSKEGS